MECSCTVREYEMYSHFDSGSPLLTPTREWCSVTEISSGSLNRSGSIISSQLKYSEQVSTTLRWFKTAQYRPRCKLGPQICFYNRVKNVVHTMIVETPMYSQGLGVQSFY